MKFCSECGKEVVVGSDYCGSCGAAHIAPQVEVKSQASTSANLSYKFAPRPWAIILVVAGIIGLIYVISTVSSPIFDFIFGFGKCPHEAWFGSGVCICARLSYTIVASIIGIIIGVFGNFKKTQ